MFIKPKQDVLVRDPQLGGHLPPEGREVEPTPYWLRRVADGDATLQDQPAAKAKPQTKGSDAA